MPGISIVVGLAALLFVVARFRRPKYRLPPGPRPWPIIGNLLDMPSVRPWETYREWCRLHDSDLIHLHLPRESAVILGSATAAVDLLEKRSQIYSGRLRHIVANLAGYDFNMLIMPYTSHWRMHRKLFHQHFQQATVGNYMPVQLRHARNFLTRVVKFPQRTREYVRLMVTASTAEVVYGKKVVSMDDAYVVRAEENVEGFSQCLIPGVYLLEYLPFLSHIPSWVPGTTAKRIVEKYRPYATAARDEPYAEVKAAVDSGVVNSSVAAAMYEDVRRKYGDTKEESYYHEVARNVSCSSYDAGIDTSTSTSESFLLAMALFPKVQEKAQAELDRVVGSNRLPEFDDIPNLPYLHAVVMETIRWLPVVPFGVPHCATADDTYRGYHIAKGTVIIPNIWAMLKDPEDYPQPDEFIPERFVDDDGQLNTRIRDPSTVAFGFGRRICPGKFFGNNSVTIFAATVLHVFDITPGVDGTGNPVTLSPEMIGALLAKPRDVPCGLKPRSESAARLIHDISIEHDSKT